MSGFLSFQIIMVRICKIVCRCMEEGRGLVIAANKADLVNDNGVSVTKYEEGVRQHCEAFMNEFGDVPVVACTATSGQGMYRVLTAVIDTHDAWSRRVDTWILNRWLKDVLVTAPQAGVGRKKLRVKYMTQIKARPPAFTVFCNHTELPESFARFLRSKMQEEFQLRGVPIRFVIRKSVGAPVRKELLSQGRQTRRGVGTASARPVGPSRQRPATMVKFRKDRNMMRRRDSRIRRRRKPTGSYHK